MSSSRLPTKKEYNEVYQKKAKSRMTQAELEERKERNRAYKRKSRASLTKQSLMIDHELVVDSSIPRSPLAEIDTNVMTPRIIKRQRNLSDKTTKDDIITTPILLQRKSVKAYQADPILEVMSMEHVEEIHPTERETDNDPPEGLHFINSVHHVGETSNAQPDILSLTEVDQIQEPNSRNFIVIKDSEAKLFSIGSRSHECIKCKAIMFIGERTSKSSLRAPKFGMCCKDGLIKLPYLPTTPKLLSDLIEGAYDDNHSKFKELIRNYNAMFSFTSMGGKIDMRVLDGRGPYTYKISGSNYHRIGTLLPSEDGTAKYSQLYIHDPINEIDNRINIVQGNVRDKIRRDIVIMLRALLDEINPYVKVYRQARNLLNNSDSLHSTSDLHIRILNSRAKDGRQYILPTSNEVAALMVGDGSENVTSRDIIICKRDGVLNRISETHPAYMPLQYPLLFPYGEEGWRIGIEYADGMRSGRQKRVSIREYYSFRLQQRNCEKSILLQSGRLLQQYIVDSYAAIEQERLNWVRLNQTTIRSELYQGLQDAVTDGETDARAIGQRFVLPSSFHGGPRDMYQNFQDAIAICRWGGPPDYFITFTCNPKWKEIQEDIIKNHSEDRPDIIARVFNLKLKELMKDLKERRIFGQVIADIHVIEFQKRGLPHAHILITVAERDKPKTIDAINRFVQAEIPDKIKYPRAHQIVLRTMIHGPCGVANLYAPCMDIKKHICSKHFPKQFLDETNVDEHGFVQYRRRNDGQSYLLGNNKIVDNRWVVPYNMYLLTKYDAHINVEICAHPKLIKYLYKYIHKGHDRSTIIIEDNSRARQNGESNESEVRHVDEIKQYLDCRYVSSVEASWRIFEFSLHSHHPSIERLPVHLPGQQSVTFKDNEVLNEVLTRSNEKITPLLGWFHANSLYSDANCLTYAEFPQKWVWNPSIQEWTRRKRQISIGRLYYAHPNSGERFYLRILLGIVRGAKCFSDIRTVDSVEHCTFKSACIALGLLEDDSEWDAALQEASTWSSGHQLRIFFCSILMFCEPSNPSMLWDKHWASLSDDYLLQYRREQINNLEHLSEGHLKNRALQAIEQILNDHGRTLKDFHLMPTPVFEPEDYIENQLISDELGYDKTESLIKYSTFERMLTEEQRNIMQIILGSHEMNRQNVHFVYGSGGTGKTFLYKVLIAKFRSEGKIVLSVASSGIAALLLPGGRTAHSRFKIPLNLHESSTCSISQQSKLSELLQMTSLIIWDEAPMTKRNAFEAVDRTLRDLLKYRNPRSSDELFGGITVVLGGDFRQILPVIPKAGREKIVTASIHKSYIWEYCKVHLLTKNMRIQSMPGESEDSVEKFISWILSIGDGKIHDVINGDNATDIVQIPNDLIVHGMSALIDNIYPQIVDKIGDYAYFEQRAILAPRNDDVDIINNYILSLFPGDSVKYYSADSLEPSYGRENQFNAHPPEYLNSIKSGGLAHHILELKEGVPVMLLRNLNISLGLCNGTRLIIHKMGNKVIQAKIITGKHVGELVLIPRIIMSAAENDMPIPVRRRQFPLKLAFAITINKSQGQTLQKVGLYLKNPVFCHGQLYVALSRCSNRSGLKILLSDQIDDNTSTTNNVVYTDVIFDVTNSIRN